MSHGKRLREDVIEAAVPVWIASQRAIRVRSPKPGPPNQRRAPSPKDQGLAGRCDASNRRPVCALHQGGGMRVQPNGIETHARGSFLGLSAVGIAQRRNRRTDTSPGGALHLTTRNEGVVASYLTGAATHQELAERYGVSPGRIGQILRKLGSD